MIFDYLLKSSEMGCVPNLPQLVGDLCEGKEKLNAPQPVAQIPERNFRIFEG